MSDAQPPTVPEAPATQTFSTRAGQPTSSSEINFIPEAPGYEIIRLIGRGGMGVVYEARDKRLHRTVALKMILLGSQASEKDRARFRQEAEAVARLQHPGIVQIYEIGESSTGPFLALEYVGGGSLADKLDGKPWLAQSAAELIEQIARAVEVAHQTGIVHRDLKPANILLAGSGPKSTGGEEGKKSTTQTAATRSGSSDRTESRFIDEDARYAKITDFGLAKRLDSDQGQTASGAILGTPSYMAPEQAEGRNSSIGPATDVYALGAILYELLTGRPPFLAETPFDTIMQVARQEPVPPSRLNPKIPADLETICLKCLWKEPDRRYSSAEAMASDVRCFREGRPISARPVSGLERGWRWCRRNPAVTCLLVAVTVLLVAGTIIATYFAIQANEQWRESQASAAAAKKYGDEARVSLAAAGEAKKQADASLYVARINLAQNALRENRLIRLRELLRETTAEHRGWEWQWLTRHSAAHLPAQNLTETSTQIEHIACVQFSHGSGAPRVVTFVPLEEGAATGGHVPMECRVHDVQTGRLLFAKRVVREQKFDMIGCGLSADGRRAIAAVDKRILVWNVDTSAEIRSIRITEMTSTFCLDTRGEHLAYNEGSTIKVIETGTGKTAQTITFPKVNSTVHQLEFSPDGRTLYASRHETTATRQSSFQVFSYDWKENKVRFSAGPYRTGDYSLPYALSPDGRWLAISSGSQTVSIWETARSRAVASVTGVTDKVEQIALTPEGRYLTVGGTNGLITIHDRLDEAATPIPLRGHDAPIFALKFTNQALLSSVSSDGVLRSWNLGQPDPRRLPGQASPENASVFEPVFDRSGVTLAQIVTNPGGLLGSSQRELRVINTITGQVRYRRELGAVPGSADYSSLPRGKLALSDDGRFLAYVLYKQEDLDAIRAAAGLVPGLLFRIGAPGGGGGAPRALVDAGLRAFTPQTDLVRVIDLNDKGKQICSFPLGEIAHELRFTPDGKHLLIDGRRWRMFDAATGKPQSDTPVLEGLETRIALHPFGETIAEANSWPLRRGEVMLVSGPIPERRSLSSLRLRRLEDRSPPRDAPLTEEDQQRHIARVIFSPSGRHLAVAAVGSERIRGRGMKTELPVHLIVWRIASDGSIERAWSASCGTMIPFSQAEPMAIAFNAEETSIAAAALAGHDQAEVHIWDLASGKPVQTHRVQGAGVDILAFTADGQRLLAAGGARLGADSQTAEAHLWDLTTGQELLDISLGSTISSSGSRTTAYHFDGHKLQAVGWNGKGGELRVLNGEPLR